MPDTRRLDALFATEEPNPNPVTLPRSLLSSQSFYKLLSLCSVEFVLVIVGFEPKWTRIHLLESCESYYSPQKEQLLTLY